MAWFQHDSNARNDQRVLELLDNFGWEGYGVFFALVEQMRDATGYRLSLEFGGIARAMVLPKDKLRAVVDQCLTLGLFAVEDETFFYAPGLRRRMERWDTKREALAEAGKRGAESRWKATKDGHPNGHPMATPSKTDSHPMATLPEKMAHDMREHDMRHENSVGATAPAPASINPSPEPPPVPTPVQTSPQIAILPEKPAKGAKREPKPEAPPLVLPEGWSPAMRAAWDSWLAYRQGLRVKLKPESIQALANQFAAYDDGFLIPHLSACIANGWQGVLFTDTPRKYADWQAQNQPATLHLNTDGTHYRQPTAQQPRGYGNNAGFRSGIDLAAVAKGAADLL